MTVQPPESACLRCIFPTPPSGRELPTCDTAGVLQAAAAMAASLQVTQAIKILTGQWTDQDQRLYKLDVWSGRFVSINLREAKRPGCSCCDRREFEFLKIGGTDATISLCGRKAVQILPQRHWSREDFTRAMDRLGQFGRVESSTFFSRCRLREPDGVMITCFKDGRLLVDGIADTARAKSICARLIGT